MVVKCSLVCETWSERLVPLLRNNLMSPFSSQKMEAVRSFETGSDGRMS